MLFEKNFIGQRVEEGLQIDYFVLQKASYFGIALEAHQWGGVQCHYEYFTEDREEAYRIGRKMKDSFVTGTTLTYILDDMVH